LYFPEFDILSVNQLQNIIEDLTSFSTSGKLFDPLKFDIILWQ
jgi:hypothetical protein